MPEDVTWMLSRPGEISYRFLVVNAEELERDYPGQEVPNRIYQHVLRAQRPEDDELLYRVFMRWKPSPETLRLLDGRELSDGLRGALTWGACQWGEDVLEEEEIEERIPSWTREFLLKTFETSMTHPERRSTAAWFEVVGGLIRESAAVREVVIGLAPEWEGEPLELLRTARSLLEMGEKPQVLGRVQA